MTGIFQGSEYKKVGHVIIGNVLFLSRITLIDLEFNDRGRIYRPSIGTS
jgi:hypothetical protein